MPNMSNELLVPALGVALAGAVLVFGALRLARRPRPAPVARGAPAAVAEPLDDQAMVRCPVHQLIPGLLETTAALGSEPRAWTAFDQLVRENLGRCLGAGRVRCYRTLPGCGALVPLGRALREDEPPVAAIEDDLLLHVASTGREYYALDPAQGPLIRDLASRSSATWTWVWPVTIERVVHGVIALHDLPDPTVLSPEVRTTVRQVVTFCWWHVTCAEQLAVARRTDPATGGLTRQDFQIAAERVLAKSYAENEPVVLVALTTEGLRGLDDTGRWRERDALLTRLGRALARRTRSDDLIGRFSDDRFVILLRRLDRTLGRLIAEKLLAAAQECATEVGALDERIRFRAGLASSHPGRLSLAELLAAAFTAAEQARQERRPLAVHTAAVTPVAVRRGGPEAGQANSDATCASREGPQP